MVTSDWHAYSDIDIRNGFQRNQPPGTAQIECQDLIELRLNPILAFDAG